MVTGMGIACPLGYGVKIVWKKLLDGQSGIRKLPDLKEFENVPCKVAGSVPLGTGEGEFNYDDFVRPSEARNLAEESIFSIGVAAQALDDANWWPHQQTDEDQLRTGVNIANVGFGGAVNLFYENSDHFRAGEIKKISPYFIPKSLPNLVAGNVSIRFKLRGPNLCVSTA